MRGSLPRLLWPGGRRLRPGRRLRCFCRRLLDGLLLEQLLETPFRQGRVFLGRHLLAALLLVFAFGDGGRIAEQLVERRRPARALSAGAGLGTAGAEADAASRSFDLPTFGSRCARSDSSSA